MDTVTKKWLILGAVLVISGVLLFTVVMTLNHWDFSKLVTAKYVTNTYSITEAFTDIELKSSTADILFVPSDEGVCQVVCYEAENVLHSVSAAEGCLTIREKDERKWYEYIAINPGTPKITVTLPQATYRSLLLECSTGDTKLPADFAFESIDISASTGNVSCLASASGSLKIKLTTGNIRAENLSAGSVDLSVSTGQVKVSKVTSTGPFSLRVSTGRATLSHIDCGSLTSVGDTGNITLEQVTVAQSLSIERTTGDVKFIKCDARELTVKTDTGNVTGSLLSDKTFITQTDTGRVEVPKTTGGRCEITTDTGNITLSIEEE